MPMTVAPVRAGDGDGIAQVIAVAVRDENVVGLDLLGLARAKRVVVKKRVEQQAMLPRPDRPGIVAQKGDFG